MMDCDSVELKSNTHRNAGRPLDAAFRFIIADFKPVVNSRESQDVAHGRL
jgi:hypothetical protein